MQNDYLDLQLEMVDIYRRVVSERYRRKELVRKFGLINIRKQFVFEKKFHRFLGCSSICGSHFFSIVHHVLTTFYLPGSEAVKSLQAFAKFFKPYDFDKMMEGFYRTHVLK